MDSGKLCFISLPSQVNTNINSAAGSTTPEKHLQLKWGQVLPPGAGLENSSNNCSINTVLQCLTHTAPLANYMLSEEHSKTCQQHGLCMMCVLEKHIIRAFKHSGQIIEPTGVNSQLSKISPELKPGRPISSIEFYMAMLEALHQSDQNGCMRNGQTTEDSLVNQIFESTLQHALTCPACGELLLTFTTCRGIVVGTEGPGTVPQDLTWYITVEQLGFTLVYNCLKCKKSGHSHYKTTFHRLPNVLVIHPDPCDEDVTTKTAQSMRYPEYLDMRPFMSEPSNEPEMYQLYGVAVLESYEKDSSHTYCYIKASDGQWYIMDDDKVSLSDSRSALEQKPSFLFYMRSPKQENGDNPGQAPSQTQTGPPCNEMDNVGASKSSTDGSLNQQQPNHRRIKLNRQSRGNYRRGKFQSPKSNRKQHDHKTSDRKYNTDVYENSLSTSNHSKCKLVDEDNNSQEERSAKRKKTEHTTSRTQGYSEEPLSRQRGTKRKRLPDVQEDCPEPKRIKIEPDKGSHTAPVNSSSSSIKMGASYEIERRGHKRRRIELGDSQECPIRAKRARIETPVLNFRDYVNSCPRRIIDELCDTFSRLSVF